MANLKCKFKLFRDPESQALRGVTGCHASPNF